MKIKCRPEDFSVEELTAVECQGGPFALFRLTKRSLGTPEAIAAVIERWRIPRDRLSYGGLKDRHAVTRQHLTIFRGPRRALRQSQLDVEYLGQTARPFTSADIAANRFHMVLRDLRADQAPLVLRALDQVHAEGLPNYFDQQRFGSVGPSREFIAHAWCLGDYERALWLALAEENRHDSPADAEAKRLLRAHWGAWPAAKAALPRSHRRSIVTYLVDHPRDFRRAFALIRVDLRRIYLAAFQSHLWNDMLDGLLQAACSPEELVPVAIGPSKPRFPRRLDPATVAALQQTSLPLPTARQQSLAEPAASLIQAALAPFQLELRQVRVKYPRDSFFSKGERAVLVSPSVLHAESGPDELYTGQQQVTISFTLPPGSYATILVKRLALALAEPAEEPPEDE